jgi:hypothetical protein
MLVAKTFEETDKYEPNNPSQVIRPYYGFRYGPGYGGYQTTFYNRVPDAGQLKGLGLGLAWATIPTWAQISIVGLTSAAVGYFAMSKFGDSHIKPALRRIGIGR